MQPSDGSQLEQQPAKDGKKFLDDYISRDDYVSKAVEELTNSRIPDGFQQTANGQTPQDLITNKEYYT
jgi:hypothetical protein